jgi:hypothetical protein
VVSRLFAVCVCTVGLPGARAAQRLDREHSSLLRRWMSTFVPNHLVFSVLLTLSTSGGDPLLVPVGSLASPGWVTPRRDILPTCVGGDSGGDCIEETIDMSHDPYWEPTLFNLDTAFARRGSLRKRKVFERCVSLCPDKFSTYAAPLTKHLMSDLDGARHISPGAQLQTDASCPAPKC